MIDIMDAIELKNALSNRKPIILNIPLIGDVPYKRVSGIIYRDIDGSIDISAELLSTNGNSVTIADPKRLRYAQA